MKIKNLKVYAIFLTTGLLLTLTVVRIRQELARNERVSVLNKFFIITPTGLVKRYINNVNNTVLLFIDTECDHCQYEARMLQEKYTRLRQATAYIISSEDIKKIDDFIHKYKLHNIPCIAASGHMDQNLIRKNFGISILPSVLIYDREDKLVRKYVGETSLEAIARDLK